MPDSAALPLGCELNGARSAPYENLRALRVPSTMLRTGLRGENTFTVNPKKPEIEKGDRDNGAESALALVSLACCSRLAGAPFGEDLIELGHDFGFAFR